MRRVDHDGRVLGHGEQPGEDAHARVVAEARAPDGEEVHVEDGCGCSPRVCGSSRKRNAARPRLTRRHVGAAGQEAEPRARHAGGEREEARGPRREPRPVSGMRHALATSTSAARDDLDEEEDEQEHDADAGDEELAADARVDEELIAVSERPSRTRLDRRGRGSSGQMASPSRRARRSRLLTAASAPPRSGLPGRRPATRRAAAEGAHRAPP